jgi:DNA-binding CsgD family transcriptional regulator
VAKVLEVLARIAASPDVDDVWQTLTEELRLRGFARVNYGFTRFRQKESIGAPEDAIYLSTADPAYVQHYFRTGFYARTPMYRWSLHNVGACTWRWVDAALAAGTLPPTEAEAVRINHQMGIAAGISISFPPTSARSKGAIGLIADPGLTHDDVDRIWAAQGDEIQALCNMAHLKITQLPFRTRRRALTDRQREALEWVADGKTMQDISVLMNVSAAMVEKHLRLARETLDVETTAHAVAKAMLQNQIFIRWADGTGAFLPSG